MEPQPQTPCEVGSTAFPWGGSEFSKRLRDSPRATELGSAGVRPGLGGGPAPEQDISGRLVADLVMTSVVSAVAGLGGLLALGAGGELGGEEAGLHEGRIGGRL